MTDPLDAWFRWSVVASLCRQVDARLVVELGVLAGKTTAHLLKTLPELHVIAVDTWKPGIPEWDVPREAKKTADDTGYRSYAQADLPAALRRVQALAIEHAPRLHIWQLDQVAAAEQVAPAAIDLVFHDADHTEAGLEAAILAWLPAIRPDGIVCGHDYDMPSVRRVLDRLCPDFRAERDSVWWVRKQEVRV